MRGRYIWNRWKSAESMRRAIHFFERAVELDPLYARAYAGLADSYGMLGNVKALPPEEAYPKAKSAALQGLAIDDQLAELHTSLGFVQRFWDWDWNASRASLNRALDLNPGYSTAHRFLGHLLCGLGEHDLAIAHTRRALDLDPLSLILHTAVGDAYFYARRYEEAMTWYRKCLELDATFVPGHTDLARSLELSGRFEEALEEFERARQLTSAAPNDPSAGLACVYASMGRSEEALAMQSELLARSPEQYVSPYSIASIHACLGDVESALTWLEKAYEEHDQTLVWVKVHPRLDVLRAEPRFQQILQKMRL
jgi:serine/threonine-protein kinase